MKALVPAHIRRLHFLAKIKIFSKNICLLKRQNYINLEKHIA
jgi:hypothetical protein